MGGSHECKNVGLGHFSLESTEGLFVDQQSCPPGTYCIGGVKSLCDAGKFSGSASKTCTLCPEGKFQPHAGKKSCNEIVQGSYAAVGKSATMVLNGVRLDKIVDKVLLEENIRASLKMQLP